ncbi:MAG: macro domain-containing protein [Gemmatimonadaceae bacterium]
MIDVRVDDLVFYEGEAIARPVNALLGATTPVMRKLEMAAGEAFAKTVRVAEPMQVGSAVVTAAGDLRVELLIHGVVSSDDEPATRATVRRALLSALQRAASFQIRELAVAPFGLGAGNLDIEDSAEIMREVIAEHQRRSAYPERVIVFAENALEEQVLRASLLPGTREGGAR